MRGPLDDTIEMPVCAMAEVAGLLGRLLGAREFEEWLVERLLARGVAPGAVDAYRIALPFAMNVTGLVRYWRRAATLPLKLTRSKSTW